MSSHCHHLESGKLRRRAVDARPSQQGAAALIVVMVLFFVMAMVAAYTSRNLIFEQKTAINQYRGTQAYEAAEAGLEWVLAELNGGLIGGTCQPVAGAVGTSFLTRYLQIDNKGEIKPILSAGGLPLTAGCVSNGSSWNCSCPTGGTPTPAAPGGNGVFPAFRSRFLALPGKPGLIQVEVNSCTRADNACLDFTAAGPVAQAGEGASYAAVQLALKGAITTLPSAPVTVRSNLTIAAGTVIEAYNTDPAGNAVTVQTGGASLPASGLVTVGPAGGMPGGIMVTSDASLGGSSTPDSTFITVFGMARTVYRAQPGLRTCAGSCDGAAILAIGNNNPGRILRVAGNATIDSDLGSATDPVMLLVEGDVSLASGVTVYGFIYSTGSAWDVSGTANVVGGIFTEGSLAASGGGTLRVRYDSAVLNRVRAQVGSFVRLPGSWRDFTYP